MATGATTQYDLPYPLSTDPVRVAGDIEQLAEKIDSILQETIEDTSAAMLTGATVSNGFTLPTYNDSTGKMTFTLSQDIQSSASPTFAAATLTGDLAVNGADITTTSTGTATVFNTNATTLNVGQAATTVSIGATTGTATIRNANTDISGDLAVNGGDLTTSATTFNLINATATTLNIGQAATSVSLGASTGTTTVNNDISVASGKVYKIDGTSVLSASTLGSGVTSSSLTSVGTISTGTWSATEIAATKGGTGQTGYTIGDILYANTTTTLAKLADADTGNVLISGGVGSVPSYGKVGLATHVSGTLPVANGGTGVTSSTGTVAVVLSNSPTLVTPILGDATATSVSVTGTTLTFNSGTTGTPSENAIIKVERGTSDDVSIRWNESGATWQYTNDGINFLDIGSGGGAGGGLEAAAFLGGM